jgi:hypothetical protein
VLRALIFFRSPRLALAVLGFLAAFCAGAAWFPWLALGGPPAPLWAQRLGLERPFASPPFLLGVLLLFLSTLACLWSRTASTLALWRGAAEAYGTRFEARPAGDFVELLRAEGFGTRRMPCFRWRHALWGGWVLHVGLLALIAGVLGQQAFHDGGAFELSEGETLRLSEAGAVFGRERGLLAPASPPGLTLGLVIFDPFLHQPGFSPDRASRLRAELPGQPPREGLVDRADGFDAGPATIYQAIPTGLALNLEIPGLGARSLHLRARSPYTQAGEFLAPDGTPVTLGVHGERALDDPQGTGPLSVWMERAGARTTLHPGEVFPFGSLPARLVSIGRWAGFTYARSPGMPAVHAGFALVLLGAALLVFPAGVARVAAPGEATAGWVYVTRGRDLLVAEWARRGQNPPGGEA